MQKQIARKIEILKYSVRRQIGRENESITAHILRMQNKVEDKMKLPHRFL